MDFSFSEDQQGIRDLAKQVLTGLVTDDSLKALHKEGQWFHRKAWEQLAESGLLGLCFDEAYGGASMGLTELCLLLEQVGRTVAPIPAVPTLASAGLGIANFGTEAQKKKWIPEIIAGKTIVTAALQQTNSRDAALPAATAKKDAEGYRVSGEFTNVAFFDVAARVLIAAKTDDGVLVALLDPRVSGVKAEAQQATNGEPWTKLVLQDARVANEDVIAQGARGRDALTSIVQRTVLAVCAVQVGLCEQAVFMTANYATERKQFGVPIGTFQGVTQRLGDAYIDVQAMKATMWRACWLLDEGRDAEKALCVAKFWASEGGARVVAAAQHIHGGMGFDRDYPLYRYFLMSKNIEFSFGGAMEQLTALGARLSA
ncbi:MAG: acyl-CoA dehydrogenase family protein [Polyangiales bacterium]